jgi:hypothetical protein
MKAWLICAAKIRTTLQKSNKQHLRKKADGFRQLRLIRRIAHAIIDNGFWASPFAWRVAATVPFQYRQAFTL